MAIQKNSFFIESHEHAQRIDKILALRYPEHTRSFFAQLIDDQHVLVNNGICKKAGKIISVGDQITVNIPPKRHLSSQKDVSVVDIPVIFEHEQFLVINKPAGVVVHETTSFSSEITVVDWLLHHYPKLASVGYSGRPGIVHRLDKDTSGIMIVPKTPLAHAYFSNLFKNRLIKKEYHALVVGIPPQSGIVNFAIGRDHKHRTKMKAFPSEHQKRPTQKIRESKTQFLVKQYFEHHAYIIAHPETGRTHQIRVHCAASGFPIVGDTVYGKPSSIIARHALHAHSLSFSLENQEYSFSADIPDDMQHAMQQLSSVEHSKK